MSLSVVLAVGLDSWLLSMHSAAWRSAGYIVVEAVSVREAIDHFKSGDFDLVLLGESTSVENKKRLTDLIRASGSLTPIVSISSAPSDSDLFADATFKNEPNALLAGMGQVLAEKARLRTLPAIA